MRDELQTWLRFVRAQTYVFSTEPQLLFQQAANSPKQSPIAQAAARRRESGLPSRRWFRQLTQPRLSACVMTLSGHTDSVLACAYAPNGLRIVSASRDGTLKLWDAETGEELATLSGHRGSVYDCAFSPDSKLIASAGQDCTVRIWDAVNPCEVKALKGHAYLVETCTFTTDGTRIISEDQDPVIKLWDVTTGNELASIKTERRRYRTSDIASDLKLRVYGNEGEEFILVEQSLADGSISRSPLHKRTACSRDGRFLMSLGPEAVRIWDATTGAKLTAMRAHSPAIKACAFSPDSKRIVTGGEDQTLIVWDAEPKEHELPAEAKKIWRGPPPVILQELFKLQGHSEDISDCSYSPDSQRILSSSWDGMLKVWEAESVNTTEPVHRGAVRTCLLSRRDARLITADDADTFKVWDTSTANVFRTIDSPRSSYRLAYSHDQSRVVAVGEKSVRVLDSATFNESGHITDEGWFQLSPHCESVLSVNRTRGTVNVWKLSNCKRACELKHAADYACFSQDGRLIATTSLSEVKLWDALNGKQLRTMSYLRGATDDTYRGSFATRTCSFSPDGKWLAASDECVVKLWNLQTGEESWLPEEYLYVTQFWFSPDSQRLATGGLNSVLRVWDIESRLPLFAMPDETLPHWSPDGQFVITARADGKINVHDSKRGELLLQLRGHLGEVKQLQFRGSGEHLVSTSYDQLRLWDLRTGLCIGAFYSDAAITALDQFQNIFAFGTSQGDISILNLQNGSLSI